MAATNRFIASYSTDWSDASKLEGIYDANLDKISTGAFSNAVRARPEADRLAALAAVTTALAAHRTYVYITFEGQVRHPPLLLWQLSATCDPNPACFLPVNCYSGSITPISQLKVLVSPHPMECCLHLHCPTQHPCRLLWRTRAYGCCCVQRTMRSWQPSLRCSRRSLLYPRDRHLCRLIRTAPLEPPAQGQLTPVRRHACAH